jgi:hypothetical protein
VALAQPVPDLVVKQRLAERGWRNAETEPLDVQTCIGFSRPPVIGCLDGHRIGRRFVTASGLEVEINIGSPDWSNINPVDPGTHRVVTDGARLLHDPSGALADLLHTCRP